MSFSIIKKKTFQTLYFSLFSLVFLQLLAIFVRRQASIQFMRIFLQLHCLLRHPFVQPHDIISLQDFGIGRGHNSQNISTFEMTL